jgi:hypothetical protein
MNPNISGIGLKYPTNSDRFHLPIFPITDPYFGSSVTAIIAPFRSLILDGSIAHRFASGKPRFILSSKYHPDDSLLIHP